MTLNTIVQIFASIFVGRTDVWGALHGQAVKVPVTVENYRRHLAGEVSLGIYPLLWNGLVRWFAIDIDNLDTKLPLAVLEALRRLGVNKGIHVATSRRKGFHVIVLLSDWALAADVRRIAMTALQMAGLPLSTEVFPKQDRL